MSDMKHVTCRVGVGWPNCDLVLWAVEDRLYWKVDRVREQFYPDSTYTCDSGLKKCNTINIVFALNNFFWKVQFIIDSYKSLGSYIE